MAWVKHEATAVATVPYYSNIAGHLNLISGDVIEIRDQCGAWGLGRCRSTSCIGICPMNRLAIIDTKGSTDSLDLLNLEVYCLFSYLFTS